jgi:Tfp pilus assembly protein PilN
MPGVGFNPYRQHRRRPSDYLFVVAAFVVVSVLLVWAVMG